MNNLEVTSRRVPALDGIRGLAILMVVAWHYISANIDSNSSHWLIILKNITSFGLAGVNLFFVLSGYLIIGILADYRHSANYYTVFYIRRACRILPAYLLLLLIYATCIALSLDHIPRFGWLFSNPIPFWSFPFFAQNFLMAQAGSPGSHFLGVTWSLAIEEQSYLVLPLLLSVSRGRWALASMFILLSGSVALRCLLPGYHAYVLTPFRMDAIAIGGTLALIAREVDMVAFCSRYRRALYLTFLIVVNLTIYAAISSHRTFETYSLLVKLVFAFLILMALCPESIPSRILSNKMFIFFGMISYPLYLLHQAMQGFAHGIFRGEAPSLNDLSGVIVTILSFAACIIISFAIHVWLERPIIEFGHRYKFR